MAAGKYNFTIEQGTTVSFELRYTDSNGNPVDLSNHTARMQIRQLKSSAVPYITLSSDLSPCGTGLNLSGSSGNTPLTSGSIGVYISAYSSSLLDFNKALYDIEIASGSGNCEVVTRILEGTVKLSKEVTK